MKTHKLFLLALTAICSLGVWADPVTFGPNGDVPFSPTANVAATSEDGSISVIANFAPSQHPASGPTMLVYDYYTNSSGYVDFKTAEGNSLKKISLFFNNIYAGNAGLFQIQYNDTSMDIDIEGGAWATTPGQIVNIDISDDGVTSARLTRVSSGYWDYTMLVSATITAESAAVGPVDPKITFNNGNYYLGTSGLDLSTLFKSNNKTGAVTYTVKDANGTGAAISGSTFTATTAGTATVTATQAAVADKFNEKSVDATITVTTAPTHDYATSANFLEEANSGSPTDVTTYLSSHYYTVTPVNDLHWDAKTTADGGLGIEGQSRTFSFWVKAHQQVSFTVGEISAGSATLAQYDIYGNQIATDNITRVTTTVRTTTQETEFRFTTKTQDWSWNRIQNITIENAPYEVSFDANGGTGEMTALKVKENDKYQLPACTFTAPAGKSFAGWKMQGGSDNIYQAGAEFSMGAANVTFTAQWEVELEDPTITFRDTIYVVDESNLDLSKLFKSNSTGAVTYTVKDAGTTGAAISGSVFTATASGTAIVTASQARVEGAYNAKSVETTITVRAYATSANFMELMANYGSSGQYSNGVATELNGHYYAADMTGLYWDYQPGQADGGLGKDGEILLTFLVKADQRVTITLGTMGGDYYTGKAQISQNGGAWTDVAGCTSKTAPKSTDFTTTQETTFQLKTPSNGWSRIHAITITDMSPKTVSFDTHGGTPATIEPITEESFGAGITLPDAPTKTDYIFDGWYTAATGGTLAGNAGATYKPADNCTLHAHWVGYALSADFGTFATKYGSGTTGVAHILDSCHYTVTNLNDGVVWDKNSAAGCHGLKFGDWIARDFSFWVPANSKVTIQMGRMNGGSSGTTKLFINGEEETPFTGSDSDTGAGVDNGPYETTEDTKFVISVTDPYWTIIKKITIEDAQITISDQAEDDSVLVANEGKTVNVQLERALTGGMFNTLCLPFDLSADQIAASDLAGAQIVQLVSTSLESQKLYLEYEEVDAIVAGKGYLIAPVADVTNPSFEAVTISKTEATQETVGVVTVIPTFIISQIPAAKENLYLYQNNTFYYPNNDLQIDGLRLYYHVNGEANLMPARMRMVQRTTPTDINIFPYEEKTEIGSAKFFHQGHLYILKGSKLYNAQGQIAK